MRRNLLILLVLVGLLGPGGWLLTRSRLSQCGYVPALADELLPNATLAGTLQQLPQGWSAAAPGVRLERFDLDGDGRALQLLGIANYAQTPPVPVRPGQRYCFVGQALTDSQKRSATRLQVVFRWMDAQNRVLAEDATGWQSVVLWRPDAPPGGWSRIAAAFQAPAGAASLLVRLQPASDDRVYLDALHVRQGGMAEDGRSPVQPPDPRSALPITVQPWPNHSRAALSFSFDWETAMGGLIHSRSDDPQASQNYLARALRMRAGVTTTLDLFRPYGIRATYYATGYNFLTGNTARRQFMGNPTFAWATQSTEAQSGWTTNTWATTPWFASDPYGTARRDPAWYFGDLIPLLVREKQDIQSHTFSHLYGGLASAEEWQADADAWRAVAAERGVPPARSLAFPWSGSAGMSDADWSVLESAGIISVTRTNRTQAQYQLTSYRDPHCRPVPGHERILACPDFYLHDAATAAQSIHLIDRIIASQGMIDLWAHTEEVVLPEQIAAWSQVVRYAAQQRAAGRLWIAPLAEIADWQQALAQVRLQPSALSSSPSRISSQPQIAPFTFTVTNGSQKDLSGLTLTLPFNISRISIVNGRTLPVDPQYPQAVVLDIAAGQTLEVVAWPV